jgi:hypothetical protein
LKEGCANPFSKEYIKRVQLRGTIQYLFRVKGAFIRQTSKSLIVFPYFKVEVGVPGGAFKGRNRMVELAIGVVKEEQAKYPNLLVAPPENWKPSTQEYAMKDSFAKGLPFTFENEVGRIDKSVHESEDGFVNSGGEVEYFTPEGADAYIRMPFVMKNALEELRKATIEYKENLGLHIKVQKEQLKTQKAIQKSLKPGSGRLRGYGAKRKARARKGLKDSATVRGCT